MRTVTILTDFGLDDWFVGTIKGVISGIAPRAAVVDLAHGIAPGNVRSGAFALAVSCRFFPRSTVHLAIVDPGVGSARSPIAVRTRDYVFVGPDNGVLSWALRNEQVREIRHLENSRYFRPDVSRTFHGRDIFAPVAAYLCQGVPLSRLGPEAKSIIELPWPQPRIESSRIRGEILFVDHFGNAISNIPNDLVQHGEGTVRVQLPRRRLCRLRTHYQSVPAGKPVAVPGSTGFVEIAVNDGNASRALGLKVGIAIAIRMGSR